MTDQPRPIRVELPFHLRTLIKLEQGREVTVHVADPITQRRVLDAVEAAYPMLCGTIRDHVTQQRRAFLRLFACGEDLSHAGLDDPLPDGVVTGDEPYIVLGAIAGG